MSDIELRTAWKTADTALHGDVEALWNELAAVFPKDRPDRLQELVAVAYDDAGKPIGVCTARPIEYRVLRTRVLYLRANLVPGPRHDEVFLKLLSAAKAVLEPWARANPSENLKGILVMFDSDAFDRLYAEPVLRRPDFELVLTGYTDEGRQIRVLWFDDARLEK